MNDIESIEINPAGDVRTEERPSEAVSLSLGFGYSLTSNTVRFTCMDGCDDICDGRVFSLIHSDEKTGVEVIMQFSFDDLGAADAARGYSEGARQKLFEKVAGGLEERENKEMVEWMRRQFVRLPEDVAPWERDRPIRNLDIPLEEAEMSLNDSGNATRFEAEVDGWLSCEVKPTPKDPELKWFAYNYFYWKRAVNEAVVAGRRVAASIAGGEVKRWGAVYGIERDTRTNDPDAKENPLEKRLSKFVNALTKHSQISNNQSRIEAMISLAGQTNLTVNVTKISNPHLLALKNGLFDTSVGMFYPLYQCEQFKNQYPTRYIDATYTPGKTSEIFYSALLSMFTDNTTPELSTDEKIKRSFRMAEYVLRILGYGLLAGNPKQKIIILCGGSSNGKSLLMDTLAGILGDEFGRAPIRELAVVKEDKAAGGTTAGVRKRILYYAEGGGDDITLSSAAVKTMTDTYVTFRAQHKDPEPQFNCCLPFISCNTFPRFDEVDAAIMRRVLVVPCLHRFVEGVDLDETLSDKLLEDKDAILSMILDENIRYHHGRTFTEDCGRCTVPQADRLERCKTCRDRCKPGLFSVPKFCELDAVTVLTGGKYVYYINAWYEPTSGAKDAGRIIRQDIADHYLDWCQQSKVECRADSHGGLAQSEKEGLYNAFRALGYKDVSSNCKRYFYCKLKK